MFYDEDAQMEADYANYLEEQAREEWERDIEERYLEDGERAIEDEAYNHFILPDLSEALEEEARCRTTWS